MNWVDLAILGLLILFTLEALGRPFIFELVDLSSFILAALLSFTFYNLPARFLESRFNIPHGLSLVLGFMAVWFLSEIFFSILVRIFFSRISLIIPRKSNGLTPHC